MGDIRFSKFLVKLLRHDSMGLQISADGYVNVDDILSLPAASGKTAADIETLVRGDNKGRYTMRTHSGRRQIKATQGHSMTLIDLDLTPINHHTDARVVLHGTRMEYWPSIKLQGLSRRTRNHIHFAPGETGVRSGFPPSCDIAIELNLELALRDGLKFFKSENGVILSPGNANGVISKKYFKKVYNIRTREDIPIS